MSHGVVIVGASHAGVQVAASLRDLGYDQPITLIHGELPTPYQRPPLSKAYLAGQTDANGLVLRSPAYYAEKNITLLSGVRATNIATAEKSITLTPLEGAPADPKIPAAISYDHLVLATGANALDLPAPGGDLQGVLKLRDLADADNLKAALDQAKSVVIAGAGFIGLEVAATAAKLGKSVTVVEAEDRVLARLFPGTMSEFLTTRHAQNGTDFLFNTRINRISEADNGQKIATLSSGDTVTADLVVVGIGARVAEGLGLLAGLDCDNGILVDETCLTSNPDISAAGDCAAWKLLGASRYSRNESVQNAVDQAKIIAARLAGADIPAQVAPWFWSDQMDIKLQMVGDALEFDDIVIRGDMQEGKFSLLYYQGESLVRVDSVNRAIDHIAARKLVTARAAVPKDAAADLTVKLKNFV